METLSKPCKNNKRWVSYKILEIYSLSGNHCLMPGKIHVYYFDAGKIRVY